jgi:hypothetical protein
VAKKVKKKAKVRKKKAGARGKASRAQKVKRTRRRLRGPQSLEPPVVPAPEGVGAEAAGQSGDTEGLSRQDNVDSESVEELTEEGQDYEAEIVKGVEDAPEPDEGRAARVRTRHSISPEER